MVSPPISLRRLARSDGHRVTYHDRSPKREQVERDRVDVDTCLGRMVQHTFAQGFQRIRSYGVPATQTFATLQGLRQEALAKVRGIVKGASKISAPLPSRQGSPQRSGRDPLRCPHGQWERGVGRIWPPT